jgi:hypothetical protein
MLFLSKNLAWSPMNARLYFIFTFQNVVKILPKNIYFSALRTSMGKQTKNSRFSGWRKERLSQENAKPWSLPKMRFLFLAKLKAEGKSEPAAFFEIFAMPLSCFFWLHLFLNGRCRKIAPIISKSPVRIYSR